MGKKSKNSEKKVKEKASSSKEKKSKTKDKKSKDPKEDSIVSDQTEDKKTNRGFDVELGKYLKYPTDEDLKRFGPLSLEARQAHTAIVLLDSEEEHVLVESLNSLQRFCSKKVENREIFIALGGLDGIWKFFHHPHLIIQRLALKLLALVSGLHQAKLVCRDYLVAQDLATLMKSGDNVVVEFATKIAFHLATLHVGRIQLIQQECIPILVALTQNPDPDVKKNALEAMYNILEDPLHIDLFTSAETIDFVMLLIDSQFSPIQLAAFSVFEKMTRKFSGMLAIQDTALIDNIKLKLGDAEYGDLHRVCLKILLNLAENISNCQKLSALLGQFMDLLDHSSDLKTLILTVDLLGRLARIPALTKSMIENNDFVNKLIGIIGTHSDVEIRKVATHVAAQLAATDFRAKHLLIDVLKPLVMFFGDSRTNHESYEYILLASSIILEEGGEAGDAFIQNGGLLMLKKILSDTESGKFSDPAIVSTLTCLNNLAIHFGFRKVMVDEGMIPLILNMMVYPNTRVITMAVNALSVLLCVKEARDQFILNDGTNFLIKAAQNPELNVVVALTPLVNAVGSYAELAVEMVDKGVLTVLWERHDLISRNGPLKVAINRLISNHLPAKYAYTGHIAPYEKLPHGFYDVGHLRKGEQFVPLEEITFDERQTREIVIYVNHDHLADPKLLEQNPIMKILETEEGSTLLSYAAQIRALIPDNVRSEKDLVGLIATVVASKMGGTLDKWRVSGNTEMLELAELQNKHESAAIPITFINNGAHRPRALMFKALADIFGIPCSLDRGGFKKCWNVVLIQGKKMHTCCPCPESVEEEQTNAFFTERLRRFVVDLLYSPGSLFPLYSYEADTYCFC